MRSVLTSMNANAFTIMLEVRVASPLLAELRALLKVPQAQLDGTMPQFSDSHPFACLPGPAVADLATVAQAAVEVSEAEPSGDCDLEMELEAMLETAEAEPEQAERPEAEPERPEPLLETPGVESSAPPSLNDASKFQDETILAELATGTGPNDATEVTESVAETTPTAAGSVADTEEVPAANPGPGTPETTPPAPGLPAAGPSRGSSVKRQLGIEEAMGGAPPAKTQRRGRGRGGGAAAGRG